MNDRTTKPTDGNPPAPIGRLIPYQIGWSFDAMEGPEVPEERVRLTMHPYPAPHGNFDKANEARRAVHAGQVSHDTEEGAA